MVAIIPQVLNFREPEVQSSLVFLGSVKGRQRKCNNELKELSDQILSNELMRNKHGKLGVNPFGVTEANFFILTHLRGRPIIPLKSVNLKRLWHNVFFHRHEGNEFLTGRSSYPLCYYSGQVGNCVSEHKDKRNSL